VRRLEGLIVATTRDGDPDDTLVQGLRSEGASVRVWATLDFAPPVDPLPLRNAAAAIGDYDWIVFTSARGVHALIDYEPQGLRPGTRVAAVGSATGAALEAVGWPTQVVGHEGASTLAAGMVEEHEMTGQRVLFPAASGASDVLETALERAGARVERVEAYRTVHSGPDPDTVRRDLERGVDVVTFLSPSAAAGLRESLGAAWPAALHDCRVLAIGPTTAAALRTEGLTEVEVAPETSIWSMIEACAHSSPLQHERVEES